LIIDARERPPYPKPTTGRSIELPDGAVTIAMRSRSGSLSGSILENATRWERISKKKKCIDSREEMVKPYILHTGAILTPRRKAAFLS
jgi:hypothetical protein